MKCRNANSPCCIVSNVHRTASNKSVNYFSHIPSAIFDPCRSNGIRHPNSLSIVDEVDCIQWLKRSLNIFDPITWKPPYELNIPNGWDIERFSLPPEFAPQIIYKGVEDLRFTPGWGDSTSEEHWSYAYLWWLGGNQKFDVNNLQENLIAYYTGLVGRNIISRKMPANK